MIYIRGAFGFAFGLILGSFANVCIWRIPQNMSIIKPRSFCPKCVKPISWYENIPVISYIFLGGKCSGCSRPISLRYPFIELLTSLVTASWFIRFDDIATAFIFTFLGLALIIISAIDIDYRIIAPELSYPLMAAGIGFSFFNSLIRSQPRILYSVIGLIIGGLVILGLRFVATSLLKKEAMGLGDAKLMMGIGAFTGPAGIFWTLFLGSLLGSITGIGLRLAKKLKKLDYIPFGPFLAAGAIIYILFSGFFKSFFLMP